MAIALQDRPLVAANLASRRDALLVLLAILLVGAALLGRSMPQPLPQRSSGVPLDLRLQIDSAGGYVLDGRPVSANALQDALRSAQSRVPDVRLRIASADESDYHALVGALALAERAGVRNIGTQTL